MVRLTKEQMAHLALMSQLIQAKEVEVTNLKWAFQNAQKHVFGSLGLDPAKKYTILPDGRVIEDAVDTEGTAQ